MCLGWYELHVPLSTSSPTQKVFVPKDWMPCSSIHPLISSLLSPVFLPTYVLSLQCGQHTTTNCSVCVLFRSVTGCLCFSFMFTHPQPFSLLPSPTRQLSF